MHYNTVVNAFVQLELYTYICMCVFKRTKWKQKSSQKQDAVLRVARKVNLFK